MKPRYVWIIVVLIGSLLGAILLGPVEAEPALLPETGAPAGTGTPVIDDVAERRLEQAMAKFVLVEYGRPPLPRCRAIDRTDAESTATYLALVSRFSTLEALYPPLQVFVRDGVDLAQPHPESLAITIDGDGQTYMCWASRWGWVLWNVVVVQPTPAPASPSTPTPTTVPTRRPWWWDWW